MLQLVKNAEPEAWVNIPNPTLGMEVKIRGFSMPGRIWGKCYVKELYDVKFGNWMLTGVKPERIFYV